MANPISISEIGTDFTIGLDVKDSVCVYAGEGAATLEQQFGGQNLVVPTTSEFMLAGERLNPVEAPVGSCRCTYTAPPPRVNGAGVTTATSNGPAGNAPGGTGAGSGNQPTSQPTGQSTNQPTGQQASEPTGNAPGGTNEPPPAAPIEASAAPTPENPAEAKVEPPVSNGGNATASKPAGQPGEENAQTATAEGPESTKPPASQGIAIDLGHAATPPPASQAATAQPAGSAPGSTPPANASGSTPAAGDNSPAFAGKLNQTPPSGVEMSSSGSPPPPQIKDPQFKAAPAPLSYQAPPPPLEVAQMVNVQAQSKQGFMVDGHVDGKSGAAAKSEATPKATATTAAPSATKPRKPYQAPGTGFWSKFKRLFSKPAPKPEEQQ